LKRRYLRRHWHGFGYYCGFSVVKKPETRSTAMLRHTHVETDLPLAWNGEDAVELLRQGQPFGYLAMSSEDGDILAGWVETESDRLSLTPDQIEANLRTSVLDAEKYVRDHNL